MCAAPAFPVKVGMLGLSHPHSTMHLATLQRLPEVSGVVLYDPDPRVVATVANGYPKAEATTSDLSAVLSRDDVPVVVVCVPNVEAPSLITRAAEAGKHVFAEKPAARSVAELRPALRALADRRLKFGICYLNRFHPAIQEMRRLVANGAIGRLMAAEIRWVSTQVRLRDPSHWLFKREIAGGGIVSWLGCHLLDALRYVSGEEYVSAAALTATLSGEPIDVEDVAAVAMRLSNGGLATLHAGYMHPAGTPGYQGTRHDQVLALRGTLGSVVFQPLVSDRQLVLESIAPAYQTDGERVYHFTLPSSPAYGGIHGEEFVRAFLRAVIEGGEPPAGPDDALRLLELIDAIDESARTGREVDARPDSAGQS